MFKVVTILILFPLFSIGQMFQTGFESSVPFSSAYPAAGFSGSTGGSTYGSYEISTEFARKGEKSIKFKIINAPGSSDGDYEDFKKELTLNYRPPGNYIDRTERNRNASGIRFVRFSIMIPTYNTDNTVCGIAFNVKEVWDNYPTPCQMTYEDGHHYLFVTHFPGAIHKDSTVTTKYDLGPYTPGLWDDYIMERNFRGDGTGIIRVYRRTHAIGSYSQVLNHEGANWMPFEYTGSSDVDSPSPHHSKEGYFNIGIYKWAFQDSHFETSIADSASFFMDEFAAFDSTQTWLDARLDPESEPGLSVGIAPQNPFTSSSYSVTASISGTPTDYTWERISGPNNPSQVGTAGATLVLSGLVDGTYVYELTITDGVETASAQVTLIKTTVNNSPNIQIRRTKLRVHSTHS